VLQDSTKTGTRFIQMVFWAYGSISCSGASFWIFPEYVGALEE